MTAEYIVLIVWIISSILECAIISKIGGDDLDIAECLLIFMLPILGFIACVVLICEKIFKLNFWNIVLFKGKK